MPENFKQDYQAFTKQSYRLLPCLLRLLKNVELRILFFFRMTQVSKGVASIVWQFCLKRYKKNYGIELPCLKVSGGLRLIHPYGITLNKYAQIGSQVTLHKGVTIGVIDQGKRKGYPIIEDQVIVFANAVICGGVKIGARSIIGPNSFVNFDVPQDAIVIGNPGKIHIKK